MSNTHDKDNDKYMDSAQIDVDETDYIKEAKRHVNEAKKIEAALNIKKIKDERDAAITAARNTAAIRLKAARDREAERASEKEDEEKNEEKNEDEEDFYQNPNGDDDGDEFGLGYEKRKRGKGKGKGKSRKGKSKKGKSRRCRSKKCKRGKSRK